METKNKLFECDCGAEGIVLAYLDEWDGIEWVDWSIWHHACMGAGRWTWKTRIRAIWDIVHRGHIGFEYGVMMKKSVALELAAWLQNALRDKDRKNPEGIL